MKAAPKWSTSEPWWAIRARGTISSGLVTASFFILGFSAYHLLKKKDEGAFKVSFKMAAIIGFFATLAVIGTGDTQGRYLRTVQPMAAAASEAHYVTQDPADFNVIAGFTPDGKTMTWSVKIPKALSLLYYLKPSGSVEGINNIQAQYVQQYGPGDYIPLVALDFWTFRLMVGLGFLMLLITFLVWIYARRKYPEKGKWLLALMPITIFFPYLANTSGWLLTETARQPWVVTGLMQTRDAVSPNLTIATVWISLVGFVVVSLNDNSETGKVSKLRLHPYL